MANAIQLEPLVEEWKMTQARLRKRMIVALLKPLPRFVAGIEVARLKRKLEFKL